MRVRQMKRQSLMKKTAQLLGLTYYAYGYKRKNKMGCYFELIRFSVPEVSRFILSRCLVKIRMAITTLRRITGDGQENASVSNGMVAEAVNEARET